MSDTIIDTDPSENATPQEATGQTKPKTRSFEAEVSRLLDIVAHSLYSEKQVFLRELISNASDACDKLRYAALTDGTLAGEASDLKVRVRPDKAARTLLVADNGIGMNEDELIENLGTIARSGTSAFVRDLGEAKKDVSLIGQFGVGFYSAFMVATKVEVRSRKAGDSQGWLWSSDGKGSFTVEPADDVARGTAITLHLREGDDEYLEPYRLRTIVKTYSDHIALPVVLETPAEPKKDGKGADEFAGDPTTDLSADPAADKVETVNAASALWTRNRSEITADQYKEFYRGVGHVYDEPWLTLHYRAEGVLEYTTLLFVPTERPFDLFQPERKQQLKLFVRRVFVTDDAELVPSYLRFLRGVVDSEDLPLNISREMLQNNPMLSKMRSGITKRILAELKKKAADDAGGYAKFWEAFGPVLKEGLYEDYENRDALLDLARFKTSKGDALVSLDEYVARMRPGQDAIYTITADSEDIARKSPQLEGFASKGVEVLLLTDPVDSFWISSVHQAKEKSFKSVTRGGADLDKIAGDSTEEKPAEPTGDAAPLVARLKMALGDAVKDVRSSGRLTDSAVCLVADEGDMDMHLERLLAQSRQLKQTAKRILEINPRHALIKRLTEMTENAAAAELDDVAWLLLDQARILEGETLPDPAAFGRRLSQVMQRGLAA